MSEYWVSKKKYYCNYCEIYIADDAPSRQQHENGLRHKGSVERFVRGIYKTGEKQKKDRDEEMREMKRVEQAAAAAYAQDISSGVAKPSSSVASSSSSITAKKPPPKSSNPYANYSTAASLGYTDPDADRLAEEMRIRQTQGVAGEWEVIAVQESAASSSDNSLQSDGTIPAAHVEMGIKRAAEGPPAEEDVRLFKLRKKQLTTGLGEIYDPGLIPVKVKKKEEPQESSLIGPPTENKPEPQIAGPSTSTSTPKWTTIQLVKPPIQELNGVVTKEEGPTISKAPKWAKSKWSEPLPDVLPADRTSMFGPMPQNGDDQTTEASTVDVKPEELEVNFKEDVGIPRDAVPNDDGDLGGIKFKKRRAPVNTGGGRRDI